MTIKEAREQAGLTQAQLAEKIGVAQSHVARWEAGDRNPKLDALKRIATVCGAAADDLLGVSELREGITARAVVEDFLRRKIPADETHAVEQGELHEWNFCGRLVGEIADGSIRYVGLYSYRNTISPQEMADDIMLTLRSL